MKQTIIIFGITIIGKDRHAHNKQYHTHTQKQTCIYLLIQNSLHVEVQKRVKKWQKALKSSQQIDVILIPH